MSEVIAGALLIFRRTRTLGRLVTFGVMFNVFMLNLAYDVPVKLFSAQLMVMGLYIALIDWKALVGIFVQNKAREITPWPPLFKSMKWNVLIFIIQAKFLIDHTDQQWERKKYTEWREQTKTSCLWSIRCNYFLEKWRYTASIIKL